MKKDLLIVPTYIAVTLFLTIIVATFFVLYPAHPIDTMEYNIYALDIFLFSALSLLPLTAVAALTAIILRAIKYSTFTSLEFFSYIFLCVFVWLLLIPFCIFFIPEQRVSVLLTGTAASPASVFFNPESFPSLIQNLATYSIVIPNSVMTVFSDLLLLRETAFFAGRQGRIDYLLFSSLGLALSCLFALRFVSKWKLINISTVLFLWCAIVWINVQVYKNNLAIVVTPTWTLCIFNCVVSFILLVIGTVTTAKYKHQNKEDS